MSPTLRQQGGDRGDCCEAFSQAKHENDSMADLVPLAEHATVNAAVAVGTCLADEPSGLLAVAPSEALCRPVSAS